MLRLRSIQATAGTDAIAVNSAASRHRRRPRRGPESQNSDDARCNERSANVTRQARERSGQAAGHEVSVFVPFEVTGEAKQTHDDQEDELGV